MTLPTQTPFPGSSTPIGAPPTTLPSVQLPSFTSVGSPSAATALFEFHPSATLTEEYTDNFFLVSSGNKDHNLRSELGVGLTLFINGPNTKGTIASNFSVSHDTVDDGNTTNFFPSVTGVVEWRVSPRLSILAADTFSRSDAANRSDRLGLRRQRSTYVSNVFSVESNWIIENFPTHEYYRLATFFDKSGANTVSHTLGARVVIPIVATTSGSVGYEYLHSDTASFTTSGHQVNLSVSRQLSQFATAGISGGYGYRTSSGGGGRGDYQTFNTSIFNTYAIPGKWSLSGNVGYSRVLDDSGVASSGISTASSFSYSFAKAVVSLNVDRGFSETFALGQDFGVVETQGGSIGLTYPITPLIGSSANVFYRENKSTSVRGASTDFVTESWGGNVGVSIRLLHWLTLGLDYSYTHSTAIDGGKIVENRGRASLGAGF